MPKAALAEEGHNSFNSTTLRGYVKRLMDIKKEQDELRMAALAIYNEADDAGIDRKALKLVVKTRSTERSWERETQVNVMLQMMGDLPLFAAAAERE